ncbi:hypothetical protein BHE74_00026364 [Ensete ventricosum]|nr:hypothetical protein GW17_00015724 [Ensete ventricosum]RWW66275.1 hypothetical protein BHE74_00026364 [Ensete ventricosum]RZR81898.1 hypothetical protein BHM03_00008204 [Ensete ventricosum]
MIRILWEPTALHPTTVTHFPLANQTGEPCWGPLLPFRNPVTSPERTRRGRVFLRAFKEEVAPLPRMAVFAAVAPPLADNPPNPAPALVPRSGRHPSPLPSSAAPRFASLSSAHILRFPPNFVRQLSTKARRNCSNIGVAQVVAASWSNSSPAFEAPGPRPPRPPRTPPSPPTSQRMTSQSSPVESPFPSAGEAKASAAVAKAAASLVSDGSLAVHAGD